MPAAFWQRGGSSPLSVPSYCSLTYKEKQIMETLSFILGIASVVVIAVAIVTVYAVVKVSKVSKELEQTQLASSRDIERVYRDMHDLINDANRRIIETEQGIIRQIDSRFDKLIQRKQLLKN